MVITDANVQIKHVIVKTAHNIWQRHIETMKHDTVKIIQVLSRHVSTRKHY